MTVSLRDTKCVTPQSGAKPRWKLLLLPRPRQWIDHKTALHATTYDISVRRLQTQIMLRPSVWARICSLTVCADNCPNSTPSYLPTNISHCCLGSCLSHISELPPQQKQPSPTCTIITGYGKTKEKKAKTLNICSCCLAN